MAEEQIPELFIAPPVRPGQPSAAPTQREVPMLSGSLPGSRGTHIPSTEGVGEDVARGVAAKGTLGLLADVPGLPGTAWNLMTRTLPEAGARGVVGMGESLGFYGPAEEERKKAAVSQFFQEKIDQPMAEARGQAKGFQGLPTIERMEERVKEQLPFTRYEPQTYPGQVISEGARFGAQGVIGGVPRLAGRIGMGTAAGVGSEVLGQESREAGPMSEAMGRFVGAIGGALSFAGASKMARDFAPGYFGKTEALVFDTLADEMRKGTANMSPEQVSAAINQGLRVTPLEAGGPKTRALLDQYAARTPESLTAADRFNESIQRLNNQSAARFQQYADSVAGFPVDPASYARAVRNQDAAEISQLYRLSMSNPRAVNIPTNDLAQLWGSDTFNTAAAKAASTATDVPAWNIRVPDPSRGINGNLEFYDQVKKELDVIEGIARRGGDSTMMARAKAVNDSLKNYLDTRVPVYADARDKASSTFGSRNAVEAGYNFLSTSEKTGRTLIDEMGRREIADAFSRYTPQQQQQFRAMTLGRISNIASEANGTQRLYKMFNDNDHFERSMRMVLGDDVYNATKGRVIAEAVQNDVAKLASIGRLYRPDAPANIPDQSTRQAVMAGVPAALIEATMLGATPGGLTAGAAAAAYLTSKINTIYKTTAEKAMARNIVPMLTSSDPESVARLAQIASTGGGRQVLNKMTTFLQSMTAEAEQAFSEKVRREEEQFQQRRLLNPDRLTRNSGGRTVKSMSDSLMEQIDRARKEFQAETTGMLNHDDETIVKALKIANERI
jgi:hypothetical protein